MIRFCIALLAALLAIAPPASAQSTSAQVNGMVKDASGARIPGATITVTNTDNQVQWKTTSNAEGSYAIPLLPPGPYRIAVEKNGFQPQVRSGITLEVDQVGTIDVVLGIGEVTQTVEVTASGPLLAVTNPTLGEVVNNVQMESLPMNGRQPFRLLELTPGIFKAPTSNGQYQDIPVNQGNETIFSIAGGRARTNEVLIDGVPSTVGTGNTITTIPPMDATEEFSVISGPLKAEWGRTGGGVLNVYTKSGGSRLHGAVFDFLRNEAFDANEFFANSVGQSKPQFRLNQYGFTLGGPAYIPKVYKGTDKTFFFVDYQGTRWVQGSTYFTTVPSAEQRQGNFTHTYNSNGQLLTIFNPFSTVADPKVPGQYTRTPFPGNVVPTSMMNSVSLKALTYVPLPNLPGNPFVATNNFLSGKQRTIDETTLGIRMDHNFGEREKIFGRFAINRYNLNQPDYYGNPATNGDGALGTVTLNATGGVIQSTTTISPTTVASVSLGYAQWVWNRHQRSWGFNQEDLGMPASYVNQLQYPLFPLLSIANMGNIGGGNNLTLVSQDTSSLLASLTRVSGRHTIKTGVDVRMLRNFLTKGDPAGNFSFTQAMTSGPNPVGFVATAGSGMASFLLGSYSSGSVSLLAGAAQKAMYYAGYAQDDFRMNSKLTLNVGLRWETTSPLTERYNQLNRFNPTLASPAANPSFPNLKGGLEFASAGNRRMYAWNLNNWEPRFGFAYHARRKTVLRGGIGLVYAYFPTANDDTGFSPSQGFSATTALLGTLDGVTPNNLLNNPAPQGLNQPTPAGKLGASTYLGQGLNVWDNSPKTPRVWQFNFDIQQEMRGFLIDLAYVGNRGSNLNSSMPMNALAPNNLPLGSALQQMVANPFAGIITTGALANPTVQRYQLLLPYPQYNGISIENKTWGHSQYDSMQLKVKKRVAHGVTMLASYTVSKLFADVSNTPTNNANGQDAGLNASIQNPYNLQSEWSVSEMDTPNNLSFNTVIDLPVGPGHALLPQAHGFTAKLVSGWKLSTLMMGRSGFPLSLTANGTLVGTRPNRSCRGTFDTDRTKAQRIAQWFDTTCFTIPAPYTYGNNSRTNSDIRSPSFTQLDAGLAKQEKLFHEAVTMTFRAEAFNVTNTAHFAPPALGAKTANFSRISSTSGKPRVLQLALKFQF